MEEKNPVYLRLEPEEKINIKKDLLLVEMSILQISKIVKEYQKLREMEFDKKYEIHRKLRKTEINLGKLQKSVPKVKIPSILKKQEHEVKKIIKERVEVPQRIVKNDIESQIQEIQRRLDEIDGKF